MGDMFDMYDDPWFEEAEGVVFDEDGNAIEYSALDEDQNDDPDV